MTDTARPPKTFHHDKRIPRENEAVGHGFIVAKRGRGSGRYRLPEWPFEHADAASAKQEAERLAHRTPGARFVVLQEVADSLVQVEPAREGEGDA